MQNSWCCTLYFEHTLYVHYTWLTSSIRHRYTFNQELFYLYLISSPQSPAKACGYGWGLECWPAGKLRAFSSQIWISLHHSAPVRLPHYNCWCLKDKGPPGGFSLCLLAVYNWEETLVWNQYLLEGLYFLSGWRTPQESAKEEAVKYWREEYPVQSTATLTWAGNNRCIDDLDDLLTYSASHCRLLQNQHLVSFY